MRYAWQLDEMHKWESLVAVLYMASMRMLPVVEGLVSRKVVTRQAQKHNPPRCVCITQTVWSHKAGYQKWRRHGRKAHREPLDIATVSQKRWDSSVSCLGLEYIQLRSPSQLPHQASCPHPDRPHLGPLCSRQEVRHCTHLQVSFQPGDGTLRGGHLLLRESDNNRSSSLRRWVRSERFRRKVGCILWTASRQPLGRRMTRNPSNHTVNVFRSDALHCKCVQV